MSVDFLAMSILLAPFADDYAAEIARWPASTDEAMAWAGTRTAIPVHADQIRGWHDDSDVHPLTAHHNGDLVAYGELWVDQAEQEIELARIIVDPAHRGIGVGRSFVTALVDHAATFGLMRLFLRVSPENVGAIRCYQAAGFVAIPIEDQETYNQRQPIDYIWLKYAG